MLQNISREMNSINFGCNAVKLFYGIFISNIVNKKRNQYHSNVSFHESFFWILQAISCYDSYHRSKIWNFNDITFINSIFSATNKLECKSTYIDQ
jgi:hypothetical protein